MQLNLDRIRIKTEAEIKIAERELKSLTDDENSDLSVIEAKLRQSKDLQVGLRMTAIKMRRDVMAVLTPEQREKEKSEHDKVMQQHKGTGAHHGRGNVVWRVSARWEPARRESSGGPTHTARTHMAPSHPLHHQAICPSINFEY